MVVSDNFCKKSHAIHHANTNHMERDQTWVPQSVQPTVSNANPQQQLPTADVNKPTRQSSIAALFDMLVMATIGWPLHLLFNVSGPIKENVIAYHVKGLRYEPAKMDCMRFLTKIVRYNH